MATVHFSVESDLPKQAVMRALVDFGDRRPDRYPNIDRSHYRVHGQGPGWADVTEGNVLAWERSRYEWSEQDGHVAVKTLESDSWGPGSGWDYALGDRPSGGSRIDVTVTRVPKTPRGWLIALGLPLLGRRILQRDLENVLRRSR
jgi:hypothetical protein